MAAATEEGPAAGAPGADAAGVAGAVREGLAEVLPTGPAGPQGGKAEVFYNPAQVFNRDLSVLVLSVFAKLRTAEGEERRQRRKLPGQVPGGPLEGQPLPGLTVLEALSATGIRAIRYAKELGTGAHPAVRRIVANDLDHAAVCHIRENLLHNCVPEGLVEVACGDANGHMYARRARGPGGQPAEAYNVIDIDPYGTAAPFLDAAVQAVSDGGLLCVTSTDMPVLAGNYPEACFARYGGTSLKAGYTHELSLRLLLHAVTTSAARYGRMVHPLLSCSVDFYVRVFVRVQDSPVRVKHAAAKTAIVHQCVQCEAFAVQPLGDVSVEGSSHKFKPARVVGLGATCPECGGRVKLGGPFYSGELHDEEFVRLCLDACGEGARAALPGITTWGKVLGTLTAISEEHADLVLHYRLPRLCGGLKLPPMPLRQFRGTLAALGYRVSHFHRDPEAVKTDASNAVVYDLMRLWAAEHPGSKSPLPALLAKELTLERPVTWATSSSSATAATGGRPKVPRFLPNPPNWGPGSRARGGGRGGGSGGGQGCAGGGPWGWLLLLGFLQPLDAPGRISAVCCQSRYHPSRGGDAWRSWLPFLRFPCQVIREEARHLALRC